MVLVLYATLGPLFAVAVWAAARPGLEVPAATANLVLLAVALGYVSRPLAPGATPSVVPIAVLPQLMSGLAYATSAHPGLMYLGLLGAPAAGAAVLMRPRDAWTALFSGLVAGLAAVAYRDGWAEALADGAGYVVVYGVVIWAGVSKSEALREARLELKATADRSEAFLSAIPDALARLDRSGRVLDVRLPGGEPMDGAELVGRPLHEVLEPEVGEQVRAAVVHAVETGRPQRLEFTQPGREGLKAFEARFVRTPQGEVVAIRQDVTQRELERRAATAMDARYRTVVTALHEGVLVHGPDGALVTANVAALELTGLSLDQLSGKTPPPPGWRLLEEDEKTPCTHWTPAAPGVPRQGLKGHRVLLEHGPDWRWLSLTTAAHAGPEAAAGETILCVSDITAEQRARALVEELRQANDAATSASRLKDSFLANMSHEIRTPLNGILGLARLIQEEPDVARLQEYAGIIHRSGQGLLALINDILDFSKIEAGKLTVEKVPLRLPQLLDDLVEMVRVLADAKGLQVSLEVAPGLPGVVLGDPLRLRQVLSNLLANAIKFTDAGKVGLEVRRGVGDFFTFVVHDTGIGIPVQAMAQLFEAFTQADASTTRRFGGSGLGLAISRSLARAMGGDIEAHSEVGQGSRFAFYCPLPAGTEAEPALERREQSAQQTLASGRLKGRRVLLAEDNRVNQLLARTLLQKAGMVVALAEDGQQALDAVRTAAAPFDVILMDIQMPVMDGLAATRAIQAELGGAAPPVVAMTADALPEHSQRSLQAGMVAHVTKPVNVDELYRVLDELVGRSDRAAA